MQLLAVQFDFTLSDLEPCVALGAEQLRDLFARRKQSDEQFRILIDLYRAISPVVGGDQAKLAPLLNFGKTFLLVARFVPLLVGENPYLQQMHRFGCGRIRLAVPDATAGAHALPVARQDHRPRAQAIFVFELAGKDIGDDLHIAMGMSGKPAFGRDPIFVNDAQRAETHPFGVGIVAKAKRMVGFQPAVIAAATLIAASDANHDRLLRISRYNDYADLFRCGKSAKDSGVGPWLVVRGSSSLQACYASFSWRSDGRPRPSPLIPAMPY